VLPKNSNLLSQTPLISPIGQPFIIVPKVDSSNNYAIDRVQSGEAEHGTVYFALEQNAGKGQRGKSWSSLPNENVILSAIIQPSGLSVDQQFQLSVAVALSCYDFFKTFASEEFTKIKWPNDLYWQDRKAGGILIESVVSSRFRGNDEESGVGLPTTDPNSYRDRLLTSWRWAVIGIGININQIEFEEFSTKAVSLRQITGKKWDVVELAKELCKCLETRYQGLIAGDANKQLEEYNSHLYKRNETVRLKKANAVFETTIVSVSRQGKLITKDVVEREFDWGEVEFVS
jgi:BirA family transcriptional regulator, biotin operon repressor / biotin---[acetyl-CoA-carboxylase] ligase